MKKPAPKKKGLGPCHVVSKPAPAEHHSPSPLVRIQNPDRITKNTQQIKNKLFLRLGLRISDSARQMLLIRILDFDFGVFFCVFAKVRVNYMYCWDGGGVN